MSTITTTHPDQDSPPERNSVLILVIGGLAAISAVIAGLVIFSSGEAPADKPEAVAPVRAGDVAVFVGKSGASPKVVVYEDFASQDSRAFEIASRDFLRIEAAQGRVQVEYRPLGIGATGYSRDALSAWGAVLEAGTPKQALRFYDLLFDRQPDSGKLAADEFRTLAATVGIDSASLLDALASPNGELLSRAAQAARAAGVTQPPTVLVDGKPLTASSPVELADRLQRLLLETN